MSRESTLMLLGVLVMASPFVGLPLSFLSFVLPVLGLLVLLIGITLRAVRARGSRTLAFDEAEPEVVT